MNPTETSRPYTLDEARKMFLDRVREHAAFWAGLPDKTPQQRCDGLAFALMALFDGDVTELPPMDIVLRPFEGDKELRIGDGRNYFVDGMTLNADCMLHELYDKP